jgi:hypothetical protein
MPGLVTDRLTGLPSGDHSTATLHPWGDQLAQIAPLDISEGAGALFFIQITSTLRFAVLYSTLV